MLAVITPFEIPEPERSDTVAVLPDVDGCLSPVPSLGDTVTLSPAEFAYTMKMLERDIEVPWPRPIHDIVDGPLIWKKISPEPLDAVVAGTLTA